MKNRIFITGGAGFIGSHIAEFYSEKGYDVIVYDNLKTGFLKNIEHIKNVEFIKGDILDHDFLINSMKGCMKIFHLAAEISVPASMKAPVFTEEVNTIGTLHVLNAMLHNGINNIVFASSAAVYGDSEECPKRLDMKPDPVSPYAITKLTSEYYVSLYMREYGIKGVIARFFNVFGERQNPDSLYAAAIPIFTYRALRNENIIIYGDGMQTRDFIYVRDLVGYLDYLSDNGNGLYNIGYGVSTTINGIVEKIKEYTGSVSRVEYADKRPGDVYRSLADISRLEKEASIDLLGLDDGLKRTIDYFRG